MLCFVQCAHILYLSRKLKDFLTLFTEPLDYVDSDDNDIDGDDEDDDEEDGEEDGDEDENIITMEDDPLHIDAEFLNMKSESPELPKYSTKVGLCGG